MTITETEDLLTVKQAAALLQLDERTIRNHISGKHLPARKLPGGKSWFIRRQDLFAALQEAQSASQAATSSESRPGIIRRTQTPEGRARAVAMLHRLREGNAQEQIASWEVLKAALNENRTSDRPMFPDQDKPEQPSELA